MNALTYIIAMTFAGVICYIIGLRRGIKVTEENHANDYDDGYNDGLSYCQQNYEMHELEPMIDAMYNEAYKDRCKKGKELIRQLDELFEDDDDENNNKIDCGEY
jgi:hypothetical protein